MEEVKTNAARERLEIRKRGGKKADKTKEGPRENIFAKWFDVGGKYYEGGFEEFSMTRREAALVLGVRESRRCSADQGCASQAFDFGIIPIREAQLI
jgi:hypothetical protein